MPPKNKLMSLVYGLFAFSILDKSADGIHYDNPVPVNPHLKGTFVQHPGHKMFRFYTSDNSIEELFESDDLRTFKDDHFQVNSPNLIRHFRYYEDVVYVSCLNLKNAKKKLCRLGYNI